MMDITELTPLFKSKHPRLDVTLTLYDEEGEATTSIELVDAVFQIAEQTFNGEALELWRFSLEGEMLQQVPETWFKV